MKLSDVIKVWDELHLKDVGDLGYCDLERAVEKIVGVEHYSWAAVTTAGTEEARN